jgi:CubicO group peptidase (beta-lactamase class C family)
MVASPDGAHVRLQAPQHPITVRELMSHRSGLRATSAFETPTLGQFPLAVRVESYALEPLLYEPGSGFTYSNAGINTAARIIEVVSGMRYEEFLQRRIFDPLGMTDTTFWPTEAQVARLATSYKPNAASTALEETPIPQLRYPLTDRVQRYPMPAGGLFSTASDLAKFCQMFLNGGVIAGRRYLSEAAIKEATSSQGGKVTVMMPTYDGYGFGWFTSASGAYEHPGAYHTSMAVDPARGVVTIWMVQLAGFVGDGIKSEGAFEKAAAAIHSP